MRTSRITLTAAGLVWLFSSRVLAQSWTLPQGTAVKDNGPRTYRFTVDHTVTDTTGQVVQRQRVSGDYTRGLPGGEAAWSRVPLAESNGPAGDLRIQGKQREFMEGFRYRTGPASLGNTMKPDFFKSFPPAAIFERNLVWDTGMIEMFGQDQFDHLTLNTPYRLLSAQDVKMPGVGTFHNRDVQLTWIGRSLAQRTGVRGDRLPRVLQSARHCQRRHDAERPQPLLGRDLGVAGDQADRVTRRSRKTCSER